MKFGSVDDVLDYAIGQEEEAAAFYQELAARMDLPWMRNAFLEFAREEAGHKAKLLSVKAGRQLQPAAEKILDLKIADYAVEEPASAAMDYRNALIIAMKKEKAAFRLYTDLAASSGNPALAGTFQALAQEEAKHKLRFELEYDQYVQKEN